VLFDVGIPALEEADVPQESNGLELLRNTGVLQTLLVRLLGSKNVVLIAIVVLHVHQQDHLVLTAALERRLGNE